MAYNRRILLMSMALIKLCITALCTGVAAELAEAAGNDGRLMIDTTYLKAHRTATSLLKKGLFPDVPEAARIL